MQALPAPVAEFLSSRRIAVAGVSRRPGQPANAIAKKLRDSGYEVFAINPNAPQADGQPCYPDLRSLPQPVEAVVIATHPSVSAQVIADCAELGIRRVWLHRSFGHGSSCKEAVTQAERLGVNCIEGGCPMMYCAPVDPFHRCMKWFLKLRHRVPA